MLRDLGVGDGWEIIDCSAAQRRFFADGAPFFQTTVNSTLEHLSQRILTRENIWSVIGLLATVAGATAFDFVVTVALGSILATLLLSKDIALARRSARPRLADCFAMAGRLAGGAFSLVVRRD